MSSSTTERESIRRRWRFAAVLAASLMLAAVQPLTSGLLDDDRSFDVFFSLLIAAVLLLTLEEKRHRRIALSLGFAAFLGVWLSHGVDGVAGRVILVGSHLLAVGFLAFVLFGILRAILTKHVSGDALFGAVCGYLLLGIIWSVLYSAVETASPGSFSVTTPGNREFAAVRPEKGSFGYFSFITLATVGYGDITPVTPLTRSLAWMEAIAGQFYLAVLVAGLVGFKVTQALKE